MFLCEVVGVLLPKDIGLKVTLCAFSKGREIGRDRQTIDLGGSTLGINVMDRTTVSPGSQKGAGLGVLISVRVLSLVTTTTVSLSISIGPRLHGLRSRTSVWCPLSTLARILGSDSISRMLWFSGRSSCPLSVSVYPKVLPSTESRQKDRDLNTPRNRTFLKPIFFVDFCSQDGRTWKVVCLGSL